MQFFVRRPYDLPERLLTPEAVYCERTVHRRQFLKDLGRSAGLVVASGVLAGCNGSDDEIRKAGAWEKPLPQGSGEITPTEPPDAAPDLPGGQPPRNAKYEYGRPESDEIETQRFTNFYEFTQTKSAWRYVGKFQPLPWTLTVDGLCRSPKTYDVESLHAEFPLEERCYRFRCVEAWAMCVPWAGFPLRDLLLKADPKPDAKYVRFETFYRPEECPALADSLSDYPWPYIEGLTIDEAMNELAFIATGIYGHQLPRQNGAPVRLVVPWKYGFKSGKSLVRIKLTDRRPATFWNTLMPEEYDFQANVNPDVPHPRWSQRTEWMLGTRERYPTKLYNGYGDFVGKLYRT